MDKEILKTLKFWLTKNVNEMSKLLLERIYDKYSWSGIGEVDGKYLHFISNPSRPTLVAHLDTINKGNQYPSEHDLVLSTRTLYNGMPESILSLHSKSEADCLGADDRAGVTVIEETLKALDPSELPNIIFTYDEEIGCLGSQHFITKVPTLDTPFILQFDRRGDDVVFYNTDSSKFQNVISEIFAKPIATGSTSDVRHLSSKYKINGANVSVGYKSEHTKSETIRLEILEKTITGLIRLLKNKKLIKYIGDINYKEKVYTYTPWGSTGYKDYKYSQPKTAQVYKPIITQKSKQKSQLDYQTDAFDGIVDLSTFYGWDIMLMDKAIRTDGDWISFSWKSSEKNSNDELSILVYYYNGAFSYTPEVDGEEVTYSEFIKEITDKEEVKVLGKAVFSLRSVLKSKELTEKLFEELKKELKGAK